MNVDVFFFFRSDRISDHFLTSPWCAGRYSCNHADREHVATTTIVAYYGERFARQAVVDNGIELNKESQLRWRTVLDCFENSNFIDHADYMVQWSNVQPFNDYYINSTTPGYQFEDTRQSRLIVKDLIENPDSKREIYLCTVQNMSSAAFVFQRRFKLKLCEYSVADTEEDQWYSSLCHCLASSQSVWVTACGLSILPGNFDDAPTQVLHTLLL